MLGKIYFGFNVIIYFLNFGAIIFLLYIVSCDLTIFSVFNQIFQNWELGTINEIIVLNESQCPSHTQSLFKYVFPGIVEGCDCVNTGNKLMAGECTNAELLDGCKPVKGIYKGEFNTINNVSYCVDRNSNSNYYSFYQSNKLHLNKTDCVNETYCGIIDSIGNVLCVNQEEKCPTIKIVLDNNNKIESLFNDINPNYIEFKLSQDRICINNDQFIFGSKENYPLINNNHKTKCESLFFSNEPYDDRFNFINTTKANEVLSYHYSHRLHSLPYFPDSFFDSDVHIYGRNFIGWKLECKPLFPSLFLIQPLYKNISLYSPLYLILSMILLLYCLIFLMIMKEMFIENPFTEIILMIGHSLSFSACSIMLILDYIDIIKVTSFLQKAINLNCSDKQTIITIANLLNVSLYLQKKYSFVTLLFVIMSIISFLKFGILYYKLHKPFFISFITRHTSLELTVIERNFLV